MNPGEYNCGLEKNYYGPESYYGKRGCSHRRHGHSLASRWSNSFAPMAVAKA